MTDGAIRARQGWRGGLLLGSPIACAAAAVLVPAMPQPLSYHAFADCRSLWFIPNFLNVASNVPFLAGGALGLSVILRGGGAFVDQRESRPYLVFFIGALLTGVGSSYYHLAPDNARLVWDRLPMTLGFAGLVSSAVGERVDPFWGRHLLWPLLALGAFTVLYWYVGETLGHGNVMPYALFQGWSVLAIVMLIAFFRAPRYSHGSLLEWAAACYGLAKLAEAFDLPIYRALGGVLSGHTIKHLLASAAVFAIARQRRLRRAPADSKLAPPP